MNTHQLMTANQLSPQKHTHPHTTCTHHTHARTHARTIFSCQENIHPWGDPEELLADVAT